MSSARIAVVVLAAGRGSRFLGGEHKLAQTLGLVTVLEATLANALATRLDVVVVTTAALAPLACRSIAARQVVVLPEVGSDGVAGLGMGTSIASGVSASSAASGWLVLPADMPLVQPATLLAVAERLHEHPVVYAQCKGRRGHPVGFSAELYTELVLLSGDEGARRLIARYPSFAVDVADAGALADIDTQEDLARLRADGAAQVGGSAPISVY
ncbi:MAG: nucleotidyltransferase family protein [Burkholderiaceae bacterium]